MSIFTSLLTAGTNSHTETSENANALGTDFITPGVVGSITNTAGVAPATGGYAVNAQGSPNMSVAVSSGVAWFACTPSGQNSQNVRVKNTASANVTIAANASGSTKYDWIYISADASKAANPAVDASDVSTLVTSRSSSNTADNGTPPTYGQVLAIVTVANGASSITNANITDKRASAVIGSANSTLTTYATEGTFDYVASGLVWTADAAGSTLNGSMTSGVVYIGGVRNTVAAVSAHAFTASKDTYIDVLYGATGIGTLVYTEVANNAASPALAASSIRIGIVVSGATNIAASTSINQGQESRVLPIASSVPYAVTDSLGNLICPRDPQRNLLGYRQRIANNFTTTATSAAQITELSCPVIVPTGRKVKVTIYNESAYHSVAGNKVLVTIWEGTVGSGTQLNAGNTGNPTGSIAPSVNVEAIRTPATTSVTYNAGLHGAAAGTSTFECNSTYPGYIKVELY